MWLIVAVTPHTTSVMVYITLVQRKRFVYVYYVISLTVDDQGSAR